MTNPTGDAQSQIHGAQPCTWFEQALVARFGILKTELAADFSDVLTACLVEEEFNGGGAMEVLRQEAATLRVENLRLQQQLFESHRPPSTYTSGANLRHETKRNSRASNGSLPAAKQLSLACDPTTSQQIEDARGRREAKMERKNCGDSHGKTDPDETGQLGRFSSAILLVGEQVALLRTNPEPTSSCRALQALMRMVKTNLFDTFCTVVIVINSFFMGYASEYAIVYPDKTESSLIVNVNRGFAIFYMVEILLRIFTFRMLFFFNADWRWNLFDLVLVLASVYNMLTPVIANDGGEGGGGASNLMRLLRLLKLLKMLRMIRLMESFRELRLFIFPIVKSLRSLFWTLFMLAIILYVFGIIMLQGAASAVVDFHGGMLPDVEAQEMDDLVLYYGNTITAMETLYMAVTGGNDWGALAEPIKLTGGALTFCR